MMSEQPLVPTELSQCSDSPLTASTTREVLQRAADVATELRQLINDRKLYTVIKKRKFVHAEGWATLGAMLGILPREVSVVENNGDYTATVELVRLTDGAIIGCGSAICTGDEKEWGKRERYARRSMALTRAVGKAYRMGFSWIIKMAGYEPTPAEEMGTDTDKSADEKPPISLDDYSGTVDAEKDAPPADDDVPFKDDPPAETPATRNATFHHYHSLLLNAKNQTVCDAVWNNEIDCDGELSEADKQRLRTEYVRLTEAGEGKLFS